jgi:hypothetical protein
MEPTHFLIYFILISYRYLLSYFLVERVALGQEDEADAPAPFEWSEDLDMEE